MDSGLRRGMLFHILIQLLASCNNYILQIAELKDCFDDNPEAVEQANNNQKSSPSGPVLLLGNFRRLDQQQILASIPPKQEVDSLVSVFFNTSTLYLGRLSSSSSVDSPFR